MLAFYIANYKITFNPAIAVEFLNNVWAREPVGALSVCIAVLGICITVTLKLMDWLWDLNKERARQGKLKIELSAAESGRGEPALVAVLSNTGREPIVIRDVGYAKPRLLGSEFVPVAPVDSPLPRALNARDLMQLSVADGDISLTQLAAHFRVRDSLGKIWEAPESEIRRARRQLNQFRRASRSVLPDEMEPLAEIPPIN